MFFANPTYVSTRVFVNLTCFLNRKIWEPRDVTTSVLPTSFPNQGFVNLNMVQGFEDLQDVITSYEVVSQHKKCPTLRVSSYINTDFLSDSFPRNCYHVATVSVCCVELMGCSTCFISNLGFFFEQLKICCVFLTPLLVYSVCL